MTLQQAPSYWLTCDGTKDDGTVCGAESTQYQEYAGWGKIEHAREDADQSDWRYHDGKDYCEKHNMQFLCGDCGELPDSEECVCDADRADVADVTV